jgi:N-glycosylase/DNA lyase
LQSNQFDSHFFDPVTSINSGQTFLWQKLGGEWYGVNGQRVLKISDLAGRTEFSSYLEVPSWEREFFRLDDRIEEIYSSISNDPMIHVLVGKYPGLRVLRQDAEQCLFSFLCASNTNIPMIRRMLYNLCRKFGRRLTFDEHEFFTFPVARDIGKASVAELMSCGLGYRSKSVQAAARKIADGSLELSTLKRMKYQESKDRLMQVEGIGNKIADCILLFSLDKLDAFPIDVWIARALSRHYEDVSKCKVSEKLTAHQYRTLSSVMRDYFGKYAGYAQQYIYYETRCMARKCW